jgi:hypothetical protein
VSGPLESDKLPEVLDFGGQEVEVAGAGTIVGRRISSPDQPEGAVGVFVQGRRDVAEERALASKFFIAADPADFELRADGRFLDLASGFIYQELLHDPLSAQRPDLEDVSCFVPWHGQLVFLRKVGSLAELEEAEREQAARAEQEAERIARFRAKQPQVPVLLADVMGEPYALTVREAARQILELSGELRLDEHDQLVITLPALLDPGDGSQHAVIELDLRRAVYGALEVLGHASGVVTAVLLEQRADSGRKPQSLLERLPDRPVGIAGGIA